MTFTKRCTENRLKWLSKVRKRISHSVSPAHAQTLERKIFFALVHSFLYFCFYMPPLFTTWSRFPLFSQGIKFNIPRTLIVTGEGGAETITNNNTIYIFPQGNNLEQHSSPPSPPKKKDIQPSQ